MSETSESKPDFDLSAGLRSRLYDCRVIHARTQPKPHRFDVSYFTFCLDLDEVERLSKRLRLFGTKWTSIFRFLPDDFIFGNGALSAASTKESVIRYVASKGAPSHEIVRVELVAHMRTAGYAFNPAAFYFCYRSDGSLVCGVLEVTNTYREKKAYFVPASSLERSVLTHNVAKLFYVSPFVELDSQFEIELGAPAGKIELCIRSRREGKLVVYAEVSGEAKELTDFALIKRFLLYPHVTLAVFFKIHWQAARLYFKRVPFIRKNDRLNLQQGGLS